MPSTHLYDLFMAVLLGIVEGVTEFLPVSSTGHLILVEDLLGFQGPPGKVFEIVIQLGAILAVVWLYRSKFIDVLVGLPNQRWAQLFTWRIILAFLPAAVIGAFAYKFIKQVLFSPWVVSVSLIVGGLLILLIERTLPKLRYAETEDFTSGLAVKIGFCQVLAMIPGVSRSGATILGAMVFGASRKAAAEFSFYLAVPTMLGATVFDLYKNWHELNQSSATVIAVGFVAAFLSALPVVKGLIAFLSRHGFVPFAYYRIVIGGLMLTLLAAGFGR